MADLFPESILFAYGHHRLHHGDDGLGAEPSLRLHRTDLSGPRLLLCHRGLYLHALRGEYGTVLLAQHAYGHPDGGVDRYRRWHSNPPLEGSLPRPGNTQFLHGDPVVPCEHKGFDRWFGRGHGYSKPRLLRICPQRNSLLLPGPDPDLAHFHRYKEPCQFKGGIGP
jgi:hypothetical protein